VDNTVSKNLASIVNLGIDLRMCCAMLRNNCQF